MVEATPIAAEKPRWSGRYARVLSLAVAVGWSACAVAQTAPSLAWTHAGGGPSRHAVSRSVTSSLPLVWRASATTVAPAIFDPRGGAVVALNTVVAAATEMPEGAPTRQVLAAFDLGTGQPLWRTPVDPPGFESASAPAIDLVRRTVVYASGRRVTAHDLATGDIVWSTLLQRSIVNASPLVVDEPGLPARIFISDYDGFGQSARLYCINAAVFDAATNPYQPGDAVWSAPIGAASGATAAYLPASAGGFGLVYVATAGDFGFAPGKILAFPAAATATPEPVWAADNVINEGFFGGVSVATDPAGRLCIYAASYSYYGGLQSANLLKADAADGAVIWSAPTNRSRSIPLPLPDGTVLIAGGVHGYGSALGLRLFRDHGSAVELLWDSTLATWTDLNGNSAIEAGEYLEIGGWNTHPAASLGGGGVRIIVGATADPLNPRVMDAFAIDPTREPGSPGFIAEQTSGSGGAPALAAGLTVLLDGSLSARGGAATADVDGDGAITVEDIIAVERGLGRTDAGRSAVIGGARAGEIADLTEGRR